MTRIPATRAKTHFGEIIRRVQGGKEYIIVERDGIPVLGILDADELEDYLDVRDEPLKTQIKQGYQEYKAGKARPVEKILSEVRALTKRGKG
ncbi:MAG: type II toxin-antitoxin system Phd/YefM family antitoxin [Candidatus Bipolaricaulota bacterium]|nr:type II toxin-antitoxin system Phd/YefM family antitoxin [Candidatus Bipolaricaulota bacterium]MDW8141485.1 type II toxin-antitoxin system Phd/YefM family antitoxin [Candidatus Bipolaricaulota bacterium]